MCSPSGETAPRLLRDFEFFVGRNDQNLHGAVWSLNFSLTASSVTVEIDGVTYVGDELRMLTKKAASESEKPKGISEVKVKGTGIEKVDFPEIKPFYPPWKKNELYDQSVCAGTSVRFAIWVSSKELDAPVFEWKKDGVIISGATQSELVIPNAQPSDSGVYTVTVTTSGGVTIGGPATLTVNPCAIIRGRVWSDLDFDCVFGGAEKPLQNWGVQIWTPASVKPLAHLKSDSEGNYSATLVPGSLHDHRRAAGLHVGENLSHSTFLHSVALCRPGRLPPVRLSRAIWLGLP